MKSTLTGLVTAIIIIAIGLILARSYGLVKLPTRSASPSPSASPNFEIAPTTSPAPSATPDASYVPTTKGGLTLGETYPTIKPAPKSTNTQTTTTTTTVSVINLFSTNSCPVDGTVYLRDIHAPLSIKYSVKDDFAARVTIWKTSGETVLNQTLLKGSGVLTTINTNDDLKFQVVSDSCSSTSDTWLKLTAEK